MAGHTNPHLHRRDHRRQEEMVNEAFPYGGQVPSGVEFGATGSSFGTSLTPPWGNYQLQEPSAFHMTSDPSLCPEAPFSASFHPPSTFKNGKPKLHSMSPDSEDPNVSKKIRKARQSKENRMKEKQERESLYEQDTQLRSEIESLEWEKQQKMSSVLLMGELLEEGQDLSRFDDQSYQGFVTHMQDLGYRDGGDGGNSIYGQGMAPGMWRS